MYRKVVSLVFWWLGCVAMLSASYLYANEPTEQILIGIFVNGTEQDSIDAQHDDSHYWVAVNDLQHILEITIERQEDQLHFDTPIGQAKLAQSTSISRDGAQYLPVSALADLINVSVRFDQSRFALLFTVPWQPGAAKNKSKTYEALIPDILAPNNSLSKIHTETTYQDQFGHQQFENQLDLIGKTGPGSWVLGLETIEDQSTYPNHYFYTGATQNSSYRVGTGRIDTAQKLNFIDFTGVEWAYDNKGIAPYLDFENTFNFDRFLKDDVLQLDQIIRLDGQPGGIAELRLDDNPVAWARINLEGKYGFINIPRRQNTFERVQIYIYRHHIDELPLQVIDLSQSIAQDMLSKGRFLLRAGAGERGNPLDTSQQENPIVDEQLGHLQARVGLSERVTLLGAYERHQNSVDTTVLGGRISLGKHLALAIDHYDQQGARADQIRIEGNGELWHANLDLAQEDIEFDDNPADEHDHTAQALYRFTSTLGLGFKARDVDEENQTLDFIQPWLNWQFWPRWHLSASPQSDGVMQGRLNFYQSTDTDWLLSVDEDSSRLAYSHSLNEDLNLRLAGEYFDKRDNYRQSADLYWQISGNRNNYLRLGLDKLESNSLRYSLAWDRQFSPGLELNLSYNRAEDDESIGFEESDFLLLKLRFDLAHNRGRFQAADNQFVNLSRGGISGQVKDHNGRPLDTAQAGILINGSTLNQLNAGNSFHARDIKPGVYRVGLDNRRLGVEYVAEKPYFNVEVAPNAVTQVDFKVQPHYGIAGRLLGSEAQIAARPQIKLIDSQGKLVAQIRANQFGYYRFDQVPPSHYQLLAVLNGTEIGPIDIVIEDSFLFKQDLLLP